MEATKNEESNKSNEENNKELNEPINKSNEENNKELYEPINEELNEIKSPETTLPQPMKSILPKISPENSIKIFLEDYSIERQYEGQLPTVHVFLSGLFIFLSIIILGVTKYGMAYVKPIVSVFLEVLLINILVGILIGKQIQFIFNRICKGLKTKFMRYFGHKRSSLLFSTFFIVSYILILSIFRASGLSTDDVKSHKWVHNILSDIIPTVCWTILKISLLLIIRGILIDGMNYSIYKKHHKQRINEEKVTRRILLRLSELLDGDINDEIGHWSHNLYMRIKPEGGEILQEDFKKYLGNDMDLQAMELFDLDNSNSVSEREFKSICVHSINKLVSLKESILGSEKSVKSIDNFLILIIIAIIIMIVKSKVSNSDPKKDMSIWFGVLISPGVVLFSAVMVDILLNINTFFILRPFDIGDKISINKCTFTSKEVGIFSSVYKDSHMDVHCFNKSLIKKTVTNYRKSEFEEVNFDRKFKYADINKIELLEKRLNLILETNSKCFANRVLFKDYKINGDEVSLTIQVCFRMRNGDDSWFLDNRGDFSLALANEIDSLGLKY